MKTFPSLLVAAYACAMLAACNMGNRSASDSVEIAEDVNDTTAMATQDDIEFAVNAADAGLAEIALAKLALERSNDPQVKELAQKMIDDHTVANDELMTIAAEKNITLPPVPGKDQMDNLANLRDNSASSFDAEYIMRMSNNHGKVVDLFEDAANEASDPDLRAFAAKVLPTLKQHHAKTQALRDSLDIDETLMPMTPRVP